MRRFPSSSHGFPADPFPAGVGKEVHSLLPQAPILLSLSPQLAQSQGVLDAPLRVSQHHCWASKTPWGQCDVPGSVSPPPGSVWALSPSPRQGEAQ